MKKFLACALLVAVAGVIGCGDTAKTTKSTTTTTKPAEGTSKTETTTKESK